MRWLNTVSNEREPLELSGTELDPAKRLVERILEFAAADPKRLESLPKRASLKLDSDPRMAQALQFMLAVLDTALEDEILLQDLAAHEEISPHLVRLIQARLAFAVTADLTRAAAAGDKPQLRELQRKRRDPPCQG